MYPAKKITISLLTIVLFTFGSHSCSSRARESALTDSTFGNYQILMKRLLEENKIEGASVALFDDRKVLWSAGFGFIDSDERQSVNTQTIFSIQSMSKTFTATAVMIAVQEGLLDLDKPITEYLPDFTISSCFENNPEKKITLRLMLGCTAGFTHEAPVGNNFNASFASHEEHYRSISSTWLKFPVGTQYSYSNLGFDLAAHIIDKVSGMAFSEYLDEKIFRPLSMSSTTVNAKRILENPNRAIGNVFGMKQLPAIVPMIGAGGVYTSAEELARFVQFHLGFGKYGEKQILKTEHLIDMYKPLINEDYALGIAVVNEDSTYAFNHNGGGFGFGSSMKWYPDYHIGCVILTNSEYSSVVYETVSKILHDYIKKGAARRDTDTARFNPITYFKMIKKTHSGTMDSSTKPQCPGDSIYHSDWDKYTGTYNIDMEGGFELTWYAKIAKLVGFKMPKVKVYEKNKGLYLDYSEGGSYVGEQRLIEYRPGLFFTTGGEALDFRNERKTYRNIELR